MSIYVKSQKTDDCWMTTMMMTLWTKYRYLREYGRIFVHIGCSEKFLSSV